MNIETLTQPEFEPVSLNDCYLHLRLDPDGGSHPDDSMLTRHIRTARREVEKLTNRSLVRQKLRLSTNEAGNIHGHHLHRIFHHFGVMVALPRPPLISIDAVRVYDSANALQTLTADDYILIDDLVPKLRLTTPLVRCSRPDGLQVDYWAGYPVDSSPGTTRAELIANVPSEAVDAILLGVQLLYDQLSPDQRQTVIDARESLLSGLLIQGMA
jgi:uncharacterized phiE125 gp8 family phage protein